MVKIRMKSIGKYIGRLCGCVSLSFLLAFAIGTLTAHAYVNTYGIVKEGNGANIRLQASTNSTALASVKGGDRVEICGTEVGADGYTWYKVYVNGNTIGYIRSDLVTDTGEKTGSIADDDLVGGTIGGQTGGGDVPADGSQPPQEDGEEQPGDEGDSPEVPADSVPVLPTFSSNAALSGLSISNGTLVPAFSPDVTQYTITVDEKTTSLTAFGRPSDESAVVSENYGFSNLQPGSNMAVITVQAADGSRRSYLFTVNRGEASEEMHYAVPYPVGGASGAAAESAAKEKGSSHIGWIIFLLILVVAMAVLLVLMGLRIRDYRRDLYGESEQEFHLRNILPKGSVFDKAGGRREYRSRRRAKSSDYEEDDGEDGKDGEYDPEDEETEDDGYSVSDSIEVSPLSAPSFSGALGGQSEDGEGYAAEDGFLYDMKYTDGEADEGVYDTEENMDEDALEDITERNSTINDHRTDQDVWKSVNFMTPSDDLEFEFLDLDDNE
ncbi:MAG: SH3 domain-containing protein [Lachnospiraceae bacterium]|nr:SH3 domain-containing protein [Lachnospiraceae bacterium]